ncbi:MAG: DUF4040 domain-containing protein [Phycisphaera sp.]|nr:DUF4040 domain-containing protein [Phycisphaera sp.]
MGLIDVIILALMVLTAVAIILLRDLFAAVMLWGIFSLLSAGLFVVMDAVDVAFTEAAVGAGISTVLMLGTLTLVPTREKATDRHFQLMPLLICVLTGAALIYGTLDMPAYGEADAPINKHVANYYIRESPRESLIPNFVTTILASYRGYDTFGETTVVFTAGIGVMLLLGGKAKRRGGPSAAPPVKAGAGDDDDHGGAMATAAASASREDAS